MLKYDVLEIASNICYHATYADCPAVESLCGMTKLVNCSMKQFILHQYDILLEYCAQPVFCGIDRSFDNYCFNYKALYAKVRDCTLFIEGTGLEIFTKSSLKKSLPRP